MQWPPPSARFGRGSCHGSWSRVRRGCACLRRRCCRITACRNSCPPSRRVIAVVLPPLSANPQSFPLRSWEPRAEHECMRIHFSDTALPDHNRLTAWPSHRAVVDHAPSEGQSAATGHNRPTLFNRIARRIQPVPETGRIGHRLSRHVSHCRHAHVQVCPFPRRPMERALDFT